MGKHTDSSPDDGDGTTVDIDATAVETESVATESVDTESGAANDDDGAGDDDASDDDASSDAVVGDTADGGRGGRAASEMTARSRRGRRAASILCAVLSVLFGLVGVSGVWIMRTAANDEWTQRQVAATLRNPAVSDQLAATLVTEFATAVDVDAKIRELLPPRLDGAAPILEQAARNLLVERLGEALRSDQVVNLAAQTVGSVQRGAVAVLSGDGSVEGVDIDNGEVRVNLLPLIPQVISAGQRIGLFSEITVPELAGKDRSEQLALLSDALGRDLPANFAQPVVFRSEAIAQAGATLNTARSVLLWSRRLFWLLLIFSAGFGAASLYLAQRRSRAVLWLGAGYLAAFLLTRLIVGRAIAQLASVTTNPGGVAAIREVTSNAASSLTGWYVVFGVLIAIGLGATYLSTMPDRRRGAGAAA